MGLERKISFTELLLDDGIVCYLELGRRIRERGCRRVVVVTPSETVKMVNCCRGM
jgi:hypothetical protein